MNRLFATMIVIIGPTLLSACALGPRDYVPPTSSPLAFFRIQDRTVGQPANGLGVAIYENSESCQKRYFLKEPALGKRKPGTRESNFEPIAATKPTAMTVHANFNGLVCTPTFIFTPDSGYYYTAAFLAEKNSCWVRLTARAPDGAERPVYTRGAQWSNGFDENSSFCK